MKTRILTLGIAVFCALLWVLFVYCCIAFTHWQPNPAIWAEQTRGTMVFLGFFVAVLLSAFISASLLDTEQKQK